MKVNHKFPGYNTWKNMRARCLFPHSAHYKNYGARGITICKRWLLFKNFAHDMGPKPPGAQIDRIQNNKGYSKANCRWTTQRVNINNRRNTLKIHGKPLTQIAEETGITYACLARRLRIYKKSPEDCLTKGRLNKPKIAKHGERQKYERDGCRCKLCKAFNAERGRLYRQSKIA